MVVEEPKTLFAVLAANAKLAKPVDKLPAASRDVATDLAKAPFDDDVFQSITELMLPVIFGQISQVDSQ